MNDTFHNYESFLKKMKLKSFDFLEDLGNISTNFEFEFQENAPSSVFRLDEMVLVPTLDCVKSDQWNSTKTSDSKQYSKEEELKKEDKEFKIEDVSIPKYSIHILQIRKVIELREIVEELREKLKVQYHWTWKQNKDDLIELILDPKNTRFLQKNANFKQPEKTKKRKHKENI